MTGIANVKELFTRNLRQSGIFIAFVAIVLLFTILTDGKLLRPENLNNIILSWKSKFDLSFGISGGLRTRLGGRTTR